MFTKRPSFIQQREGVQGGFAPLLLGYLQVGVVTMAQPASSRMVWFAILEKQNRSRSRTEYRTKCLLQEVKFCDRTICCLNLKLLRELKLKFGSKNAEAGIKPTSLTWWEWNEKRESKRGGLLTLEFHITPRPGSTFPGLKQTLFHWYCATIYKWPQSIDILDT